MKAADVVASHGETTPLESMHYIYVCQKCLCVAPGLLHLWVVGQQIVLCHSMLAKILATKQCLPVHRC